MSSGKSIRVLVVTPEKTIVDEQASAVRIPLFDGSLGVLPGRAPLVGRLGFGELLIRKTSGDSVSFFIEEGFVQVKGGEVSVLTPKACPLAELNTNAAQSTLNQALGRPAKSELERVAKTRDVERARRSLALARR